MINKVKLTITFTGKGILTESEMIKHLQKALDKLPLKTKAINSEKVFKHDVKNTQDATIDEIQEIIDCSAGLSKFNVLRQIESVIQKRNNF